MFLSTTTIFLLQIGFILTDSQIYFPSDDDVLPYLTPRGTTQINAWKDPNANAEYLLKRSLYKITLDVNRVGHQLTGASDFAFGPATITGVLSLVLLASVGQTFDEIVNTLGFKYGFNVENDNIEVHEQLGLISQKILRTSAGITDMVSYKTGIFLQAGYPVRPEFKQAAYHFYQSDIVSLDFKSNPELSYNYINQWVVNGTNGKISSLLENVPPSSTKAIIAGVIYFKGAWEQPFITGASRWAPFYINGKSRPSDRKAMMMFNGGVFPYYKDKQLGVEILGLPYKDRYITMYVIVPRDSNLDKLTQLESSLTPSDIERLVNSTRLTEAMVGLPKMKIESTFNLKNIMENLGIHSLFNPNKANLALLSPGNKKGFALVPPQSAPLPIRTTPASNLYHELVFSRFDDRKDCGNVYNYYNRRCRRKRASPPDFLDTLRREYRKHKMNLSQDNPDLYVNQFIHKIFMDINEVGTEAAASSGVSISRSGKLTVKCDVPFLFFIYHEHINMILFWGSIRSPNPSIFNE